MTKYRNPRKELEMLEVDELEAQEAVLAEPAKSVEEEVWKKRYADQQRYLTQVKNESKSRLEEVERKLDQALRGQLKAPKSDSEVETWMKEYPEFAGILETIVQKRISEATSTTKQKLTEIEGQQKELEAEKSILALKKLHPDLDELTRSADFHDWLGKQRQKYQDAIYKSLDVDEADFVISKYKTEAGKTPKSQGDDGTLTRKDAAKVVRNSSIVEEPTDGGDYEFTESQVERESKRNRKWYDANEDKILDAMRRGKFNYDLSGGAR